MKMMKMLIMIMMTMRMIINKSVIKNKECPNCKAIHSSPKVDNWLCWKCARSIPKDTLETSYY